MSAVTALLTVALCVSLLLVTCRLLGCAWRERRDRAYYIGWALLLVAMTALAISLATDGPAPGPQLMQLGVDR